MLKRIRKFEKLNYCLCKAELDLEFLLHCKDSNVIPNFLKFLAMQCQLKLLEEEVRQKKSDIRALKKEFNSSHSSLQNKISFIDFAHVSS